MFPIKFYFWRPGPFLSHCKVPRCIEKPPLFTAARKKSSLERRGDKIWHHEVMEGAFAVENKVMKRIAISQSNYIPWKGYFDFINSVDEFVLYDDVQFTRRDWRNRNLI